jgi:hypothetical protein
MPKLLKLLKMYKLLKIVKTIIVESSKQIIVKGIGYYCKNYYFSKLMVFIGYFEH